MRRLSLLLGALALWALSCVPLAAPSVPALADARSPPDAAVPAAAAPLVVLLRVDGAIGPAVAEHVRHGLAHAAQRHAQLVLLQLDTPGGLDSAMRDIIKDILASPVPVVSHVAPSGARAASAGTYIVYASHVAAMAPATTLGAATPVAIGMTPPGAAAPASAASGAVAPPDVLTAKRVSDAAAYIRALALLRGRNAEWAERAVRESLSLPASEALAQHVVDLIAPDAPALLRALDGRSVLLASGARVQLATGGARLEPFELDWRGRLLAVLGEPSLALLLLALGFYGLLFEFANPGFLLPGVVGAVCLLLGLFGLQTLPISHAGLALLLLGLLFFVAEIFVPSFGVLGLGGAVAFTLGALMLVDSAAPGFGLPRPLVYALALALFAGVGLLAWLAARSRRRPLVSGAALLVGAVGEVIEVLGDAPGAPDDGAAQGWAELGGERWRVRSARPLRRGERVRVRRRDGLTLEVEPEPQGA